MSLEYEDRRKDTNSKCRFLIIQDYIKQVFEGDSWKDCIDFLKLVMEEQPGYIHRYNERDGTLTLQNPYSGECVTTLRSKIVDLRGKDLSLKGERKYDGLDITGVLTAAKRS